jgi:hypothetical protein
VFDGRSVSPLTEAAVVMHVALPADKLADVSIINVFHAGSGEVIRFDEAGFGATTCRVNGVPANLAHDMQEKNIDPRLPLTAEYGASVVNVSVQQVDRAGATVTFYAPVFPGVDYRFAAPVDDYVAAFETAAGHTTEAPAFACNCILNYVHANLEGRRTGHITGPMTFRDRAPTAEPDVRRADDPERYRLNERGPFSASGVLSRPLRVRLSKTVSSRRADVHVEVDTRAGLDR